VCMARLQAAALHSVLPVSKSPDNLQRLSSPQISLQC
jgi:hypothetical protein